MSTQGPADCAIRLAPALLAASLALAGCGAEPARPPATPSVPTVLGPTDAAAAGIAEPTGVLPPGVFRLHIESPVPVPLTEHLGVVEARYRVASLAVLSSVRRLCVSPCDAVIDARAGHELTLDATEFPVPSAFHLPGEGGDLTLFVKPGNGALLTTGRWATALGAIALGFGTISLAFDYKDGPVPVTGFNAAAVGMVAGGAVAIAVGIPLLLTKQTRLRFATGALARMTAGRLSF